MFEKREFVVKTRKADKSSDPVTQTAPEIDFDEKVATAIYIGKIISTHIAIGVASYVLLDTFRQVQVAKHTHPQR